MGRTFIFQGMCYSGKSTLGKKVADAMGVNFLDSRDQFFKFNGMSEIDYLKRYGLENFKEQERKSLMDNFEGVFSCGGSAIYYKDTMDRLNKKYEIIWLDVDLNVIKERRVSEYTERPIVYPPDIDTFDELYEQRSKLYSKCYKHRIKVTENETIEQTTKKILNVLKKDEFEHLRENFV
jgi:shikimate kinase